LGGALNARDPVSLLEENEAHQLILLGGLPGSGKSFYISALVERGWREFDDFQTNAPSNSVDFRDSRQFPALVAALGQGDRCVVGDIRLIHQPYRESAQLALGSAIGPISSQFQVYENQPALCSRNVERDLDRRLEDRLKAISHWTHHHSVPSDAVLLRVWRNDS
jgi:hypothetical protein